MVVGTELRTADGSVVDIGVDDLDVGVGAGADSDDPDFGASVDADAGDLCCENSSALDYTFDFVHYSSHVGMFCCSCSF